MNRKLFWLSIVVAFMGIIYTSLSVWSVSIQIPPFNSVGTVYSYKQIDTKYANIPNLIGSSNSGIERVTTSSPIENPEKYNLVFDSQFPYHSDTNIFTSAVIVALLICYLIIIPAMYHDKLK